MSTVQSELFRFLRELSLFESEGPRKATLLMTDYPYIGVYLDYAGSPNDFVQALLEAVTARGQQFTIDFFTSLEREVDLGVDMKDKLAGLLAQMAKLDMATWRRTFPAKPLTAQDRAALTVDVDMLAATVVSTVLRPYFELGADNLDARAAQVAGQVAAEIEQAFAGQRPYLSLYRMFTRDPQANEADFLANFRDALEDDPDLSSRLVELLTAEPETAEAALQSMVKVSQNIETVKGDVVGAIVGSDVLQDIGVVQDIETVESGGTVVGAVVGESGSNVNIGGTHHHGPTYEAGSQHNEETINAEGGVVATGGSVAAGSRGVAVGGDVSGGIIVTGDDNTVTRTDVDTGGGAYVAGDVNVSDGDFVGRDKVQGDTITANITGSSNVAVGKDIHQEITTTSGLGGDEIAAIFEQAFAMIQQGRFDDDADQDEVVGVTKRIEAEVVKGDDANINKVERRLKSLLDIAPDVAEVVIAGLANPVAGVATAISKLAQRLQASLRE